MTQTLASPYDAPELYDLVLDHFRDDLPLWLAESRQAGGPVLEVACGTGRVLLHLLEHGIDADGIDLSAPMLERLRHKAATRSLDLRVRQCDMRNFDLPRRYRRVFLAFNGFAHCDTTDDQIRTLRCCREHLEPGGALVIHMTYPTLDYWNQPVGVRVLEVEVLHPETGHPVRMYDTRDRSHVGQRQHSIIDIEEFDGRGALHRAHRFETTQRWVYRYELELLLSIAGFARTEIVSAFDRQPFVDGRGQMLAYGWRD